MVIVTPKRHFLSRNDVFSRILRKNTFEGIALLKNPKMYKLVTSKVMAKSRIWGAETPEPIATKFCMPGAIQDLIMHTNFGKALLV